MAVKPIPDGYHSVTPYLVVHDVARLIDFLCATFEAKVTELVGGLSRASATMESTAQSMTSTAAPLGTVDTLSA